MKILILDILIFTVDFILFVYFTKVGLKTTDMTTILICCVAMTYEIYLMMRFFIELKLKMKEQKDLKYIIYSDHFLL